MIGLGTIINVVAIIIGGLLGKICGGFLSKRYQETLNMACGVSVLFLGIAGALEGMCFFGHSGRYFARYGDITGRIYQAYYDGSCVGEFVHGGLHTDFLCGRKSGLGQKGAGSKPAAGDCDSSDYGVCVIVERDYDV